MALRAIAHSRGGGNIEGGGTTGCEGDRTPPPHCCPQTTLNGRGSSVDSTTLFQPSGPLEWLIHPACIKIPPRLSLLAPPVLTDARLFDLLTRQIERLKRQCYRVAGPWGHKTLNRPGDSL
ncbi:hypothetical protein J6590_027094 [Homalodisca vitripennis]|nr:hypothetical protein J6590_027094 [Homalodisca vitripennis]